MITVLLAGLALCLKYKAPLILLWVIIVAFLLCLLVFLTFYIFCFFTDREALRGEWYLIFKMAIEKGICGDNITGILANGANTPNSLQPHDVTKAEEKRGDT